MRTGRALALALVVPVSAALFSAPSPARADDATAEPRPASPPPPPPEVHKSWLAPPRPIWPLIAAVVVAGAGVAVSAVYAVRAGTDQSSVDSWNFEILNKAGTFGFPNGTGACSKPTSPDVINACNGLKSSQDAVNTDNTLIIVGGVVTGTAVVAGLLYYFLGPGKGDPQQAGQPAGVSPWLSGNSGGVSFVGQF
jgi:hypothetical protein